MEDALNYLRCLVQGKEWFYDVKEDRYHRLVVYTLWQSKEILEFIPSYVDKYQVLIHFAISTKKMETSTFHTESVSDTIPCITHETIPPTDLNIDVLIMELDRLEKICGVNALESIFYEEHDGKNCITNLSSKYSDVRSSIHVLYEKYGFDIIYNELEISL